MVLLTEIIKCWFFSKKGALENLCISMLFVKENCTAARIRMVSKLLCSCGGDEEIRTLDLSDANRTLSQLSYAPVPFGSIIIA